ncbi:molybdenum cofactor guanylyltransferase [Halorubrum sp. FL23]|uniref:molybdenum cofactor guanylyltransferase n=1 Tax=Halorubrum sp. FL23 TaxID=3458704 RepID=UPI004034AAE7
MTTGLVLAGGRSTRFGDVDKAFVEFDGSPLVKHVVDTLDAVSGQILVSCRKAQRSRIEGALSEIETPLGFVIDTESIGPLGGIRDGLSRSQSEWTFVVACDFPLVSHQLLAVLSASEEDNAAVPTVSGEQPQPLCGRYRTDPTLDAARSLLEAGERRPMELLDRLDTTTVDIQEVPTIGQDELVNVNTPADLRHIDQRTRDH